MLAAERLQKIEEIVNEKISVRVTELSEMCSVTEETIRRDLDKLEREGKLTRSHGGAVSIKETQPEIPYAVREATNMEEKKRIAAEAVRHIEPRDRIALDASTTAWYMARMMPDIPLTVLTNSIKVAVELSAKSKIKVISTGGILTTGSLSFVGPLSERSLDLYHVDKLFMSSKGARLQGGISESNELQALVKQKMISISDQVFLLCDYSKFGIQALTHVCSWDQIHHLITDSKTNQDVLTELKKMPLQVTRLEQ